MERLHGQNKLGLGSPNGGKQRESTNARTLVNRVGSNFMGGQLVASLEDMGVPNPTFPIAALSTLLATG